MTAEDYELLSAYIDEMLTDGERSALEARLQTEKNLRDELDALQDTVALVKGLPRLKAPRNFTLTPEMVGMVSVAPRRKMIAFPMMALASAAASFLLVAFGLLLLFSGDDDVDRSTQASEPMVAMPAATQQPEAMQAQESEAGLLMNTDTANTGFAAPMTEDIVASAEIAPAAPVVAPLAEEEDNADAEGVDGQSARAVESESAAEEFMLDDETDAPNDVDAMIPGAADGMGGSMAGVIKDISQLVPPPVPDQLMMAQIEVSATASANVLLTQQNIPADKVSEAETDTQSVVAVVLIAIGSVLLITSIVLIYRWRM